MSSLRVYLPVSSAALDLDGPTIFKFPGNWGSQVDSPYVDSSHEVLPYSGNSVRNRARMLHHNRTCPECERPVVEPLELDDATTNRNGLPIPGTSTIVGFRCQCCEFEWPARV